MRELSGRLERKLYEEEALPSHRDWPAELKAWLVFRLVMSRMALYQSKQVPWEQLLRAAFMSGGIKASPGPDGKFWAMNGPIDDMLVAATRLAAEWQGSEECRRFMTLLTGPPDAE
jgi:hypothetical protein